jgi:hypothetical protein
MQSEIYNQGAHAEAVFEVLVLLQERRIVDDDLRVGNPELEYFVVNTFGRLHGTNRLFKIHIKGPQFEGFE